MPAATIYNFLSQFAIKHPAEGSALMSLQNEMISNAASFDNPLIDTHCHLDMREYNADLSGVLARSREVGVTHIVTIGIDLDSSLRAIEIAERYPDVSAAVGIHPHSVGSVTKEEYRRLIEMAAHPKVVGYGEIGLDYVKKYAPVEDQRDHFARQLSVAKELGLPVILHDREAHNDVLHILKELQPFPAGGVMHCYSGDYLLAEEVLALGFHISIPGIVTFKNAAVLQEVAARIPLSAMLLETDGPYLAPMPNRGKRNEPAFLIYIAQKIAELRSCSLAEVCRQTTENARSLFRL
jgi:TatD DNase family protein